jgi:S-adenosylmethionine-dependent carboxyl methyltransferase
MQVTSGMIGQGFYNDNSAPQLSAISYVLPWLDTAIDELPLDDQTTTIGLVDFGCSEGANSVEVLKRLIAAVRKTSGLPIQTIHSDLPTNDFSELFLRLSPKEGGGFGDDNVFSAAVGGSMFDQLLPPNSVHFATTFNAIGFLSKRPLDQLPGYILPNGPSKQRGVGQVTTPEKKVFADQANSDLQDFVRARAGEIVPGGKLLIQVFGAGEEYRTCDGLYDVLNDAVLMAVDQGMISRGAYDQYYQPVYFRTLDELTSPFKNQDSEVSDLFTLERSEVYEVPVPFVQEYEKTGDINTYAAAYTNFFRAFTEAVLRLNFAENPLLDALVEFVFERSEQLVRQYPERYEFHYVAVAALLTRNDDL